MKLPDLSDKAEFTRIGRMPGNRKYKYLALISIFVGIVLMLVPIIGIDSFQLSVRTYLILRGFAGICAMLFIIFVTIYVYRVYKILFNQKPK